MADAIVSIAVEKLTHVLGQQLALFAGSTDEVEGLKNTFQSIKAVLADAERRQVEEKSVHLWLSRLRQVAYEIDDLLDEWLISGNENHGSNDSDGVAGKRLCASSCLPSRSNCLDRTVSRYKVARDIREIRRRLDEIAKGKDQFNTSSFGMERRPAGSRTMTSSHMKEEMIGRDDDKDTLISRLVSGSSSGDDGQQVQVIAIVGIGGLGKTTLARQIYHDSKVRDHFEELLYWVCVSEDFDLKRLTKAIIEQVKGASTSLSELDSLQKELVEALKGKRFLLVLDDVWNGDKKKWNALQPCLTSDTPGSRILVTTRLQVAAKTMNAAYIHHLKGLSDDLSWTLFRSIAFDGRRADECSQLESVGREIVNKCKGVPLSITVMGSVMNSKKTVSDWQNMLDSKMWSLPETENKILPALWLSYYNLPTHLKQCFVYCSVYPKDQVIYKDVLVKLWIVQGFVQSQGNREIEDIGAEYFDDLVTWSMFEQVEEDGEIAYTMHDLLHDLAEFIARDEIYTLIKSVEGKSDHYLSTSNVRHAFLSFAGNHDKPKNILCRAKRLRTLLLDRVDDGANSIIDDFFHEARFLRALVFMRSLSGGRIVKLPNAIGKIKHLRYLDLSHLNIEELPESVCNLRNLHTLNLNSCNYLKKLPRGMGGMVRLRHLEIEQTDRLEYLPKGLGRISGLQRLRKFIVGGEGGCGIDELEQLNSLQGSLQIQCLERVSSQEEAEKAQLWNKPYICSLQLITGSDDDAESERMGSVLEGLRPHENLQELKLSNYRSSKLPRWIEVMPCLRNLELYSGPKLERLPHLPSLKAIKIWGLGNELLPNGGWERLETLQKLEIAIFLELKCLPDGLTQLQSLEHLEISDCNKLESLPEGLGQLKKLKSLIIIRLDELRCLPDSLGELESLEHLEISAYGKLESLPHSLGQLKALKYLSIAYCNALRSLPDGLQHLSLLQELQIKHCPLLLERCRREGGVDWHKISHIPSVYIDDERIQP